MGLDYFKLNKSASKYLAYIGLNIRYTPATCQPKIRLRTRLRIMLMSKFRNRCSIPTTGWYEYYYEYIKEKHSATEQEKKNTKYGSPNKRHNTKTKDNT
jgi:hypothetical protein